MRSDWVASGAREGRLFRVVRGRGPWMTLLHGFPTSSWDWAPVAPALAERFTLLAPDFLGFGESDKPRDHRYTIHEQADLVEALWDAHGVGSTELVAHDYGVSVAQELLARNPARIRAVTFLNGGLWPDLHRPLLVQRLLHGPLGPWVGALATRRTFASGLRRVMARPPPDAEIDQHWDAFCAHGGKRVAHRLLRYLDDRREHEARWVGAVEAADGPPKQFVWGARDPVSGGHVVPRIRERVPRARLVVLEDAGHYPQLEAPERVVPALLGHHVTSPGAP